MVAETLEPQPRILACAREMNALLDDVVDADPLYLRTDDKAATLVELAKLERRVAELKLRTLTASADVADQDGHRDIASWVAAKTHADLGVARSEHRLATAVDKDWARVRAGMAAGVVSTDHARVIVKALGDLKAEDLITPDVLASAEAHLVQLAAEFGPKDLRLLARHLLTVVAPEIAEAVEAKRLEREEDAAREKTRFTHRFHGDGTARGVIVCPDESMERLLTYLHSFTNPRKQDDALTGDGDKLSHSHKLGLAFLALLEHLNPKNLPEHGGDTTTLLVTIGLDALTSDLGAGAVVGGPSLSATAVRRLACSAGIIPVVLGGQGEILDLGRTRRLFSSPQRKALRLRDQTCRADGCSIPAAWTEAHHLKPWSQGGQTDLAHGICLCSFHHHRIHDPNYEHQRLPNGDIRFHRRT